MIQLPCRCGGTEHVGTCGLTRTARYYAIPTTPGRFTEPPLPSRPNGNDRWRKVAERPWQTAENVRDFLGTHTFPRFALLEGAAFLS